MLVCLCGDIGLVVKELRLSFEGIVPSVQKNFTSFPSISESSLFASELVPRRSHWLVSHFSPKTSLTIV